MFKQLLVLLSIFTITASPAVVIAKEGHSSDCASCHSLDEKEAAQLLSKIGGTVKSVKQAPVKGFFELQMEKDGKQGLLYLDYSKKKLMQGMVFSLDTLQPLSSHPLPQQPKQVTSVDPKTIPVANSVVMGNPKASKKI